MLTVYDCLLKLLVIPVLRLLSLLSSHWHSQLQDRELSPGDLSKLTERRGQFEKCVLIFCSSAGELEQAMPIIDRINKRSDSYVHVLFFSSSGRSFAESQQIDFDWSMVPFDTQSHWIPLLDALRPNIALIIRHEVWPGFLAACSTRAPTILINASRSSSPSNFLKNWIQKKLYAKFAAIGTVQKSDAEYFHQFLADPKPKIFVGGDTKYDRVIERAEKNHASSTLLRQTLEAKLGPRKVFIIGSAWIADISIAAPAFAEFVTTKEGRDWLLAVAPHELTEANIRSICTELQRAGLSASLWSKLEGKDEPSKCQVIVFDCLGILAELYGCAQIAMIGGASHHKIHNVLEAAAYGLPIMHGPRYANQREAVLMFEKGFSRVVTSSREVLEELGAHLDSPVPGPSIEFIKSLSGASARIVDTLDHLQ